MQTGVPAASRELFAGIEVQKVTSRGHVKQRVVTISMDRLAVLCTHQRIKKKKSPSISQQQQQIKSSSSFKNFTGVMSTVASSLPLPLITRKGVWGLTSDLRGSFVRYMDVADIDYVCTGTVTTRKLEYTRTKNRLKGQDSDVDVNKMTIVTIGHHGDQTLDVFVENETERQQLIACINQMRQTYQTASLTVSRDALLLRYIWYDVDVNHDARISEKEFAKILPRINFNVKNPAKTYRNFCNERSLKNKDGLALTDVLALLHVLKNNPSGSSKGNSLSMANVLWDKLFGVEKSHAVGADDFMTKFLHGAQGETSKSMEDVLALFTTINAFEIGHKEGEPADIVSDQQISRARFEVYLYHELNDACNPDSLRMVDDGEAADAMNQPLSAYYINTSHNTYLTGDQLQSNSSVEMYARALRRGCKCLELDCWDGEGKVNKNGDVSNLHPVVFHGFTLTSKILFDDILQVVKNYLQDNPDTYPIILSLETHCSHPFQLAMAKLLVDVFGEKLYVPEKQLSGDLPSPENLRGMIVIKGKRPPDDDDAPELQLTDNTLEDDPYDPLERGSPSSKSGSPSSKAKNVGDPNGTPVKPPQVCKELALLTLFHGTKWRTFEKSIQEPMSHMHSIGESKIVKILAKSPQNAALWRQYNAHHMTRTYPAGSRVDSSNYNPLLAWSVGCQLVALNFQTTDAPLVLNDGLFRQNAGYGYVLKAAPAAAAAPDKATGGKPALKLKIRILSGSCLPKPLGAKTGETIDPYVQVSVHDVMTSAATGILSYVQNTYTTVAVNDNGFCPVWNENGKEFAVYSPDVAMVQFTLKEADIALADDVGYAAIPLSCLRTGYRSIRLYDRNNTRTGPFNFASLLVEMQVTP